MVNSKFSRYGWVVIRILYFRFCGYCRENELGLKVELFKGCNVIGFNWVNVFFFRLMSLRK